MVEQALRQGQGLTRVRFRFDYQQLSNGSVVSEGETFGLAPDWLVDSSPAEPGAELGHHRHVGEHAADRSRRHQLPFAGIDFLDALAAALRRTLAPGAAEAMGRHAFEHIQTWSFEQDILGLRRALAYFAPKFTA